MTSRRTDPLQRKDDMPDLTPQRQRVLREAETLKDALLVLGWRRSAIVEAIGKEDHDVPGAQP